MAFCSRILRIHHMTDPTTTPIHGYSPFGWHYLNPGNIDRPRLNNRNYGLPWHGHRHQADFGVRVDIDQWMHPSYRLALEPLLKKTAQANCDKVEDVFCDYTAIASKIPTLERHVLLAKLAEFAARNRAPFHLLMDLWRKDPHTHYVEESNTNQVSTPPLPLVLGMMLASSELEAEEWKLFYTYSKAKHWNTTPQFSPALWGKLLKCAGKRGDPSAVLDILHECVDTRTWLEGIPGEALAYALNCITETEHLESVKKVLFQFPSKLIGNLHAAYLRLRVHDTIPLNDAMFYHVHWQFRIRRPMHFLPRRQYFDHFPSVSVEALGRSNAPTDDLLKQRVQQWKDEGILPQDYDYEIKVHDAVASLKEINKKQPWRRTKPKLPKHMDPRAKAG